jgi:RNA polymerase sigma-70 factor (ECF subfamily)
MHEMEEDEVIERCRRGDLAAYQMIYERYEQPLLRTARRMLGRAQDAEDAVQDTFLKLYRGIHGFKRGARFSTYLFRILLNACYDLLRKKDRADFKDIDADHLPVHSSHEVRHSLAEAVAMLPRQMKACFVLFAVEEFTTEEVARILDVSAGSVKTNVHRARQKLRAWLSESRSGDEA